MNMANTRLIGHRRGTAAGLLADCWRTAGGLLVGCWGLHVLWLKQLLPRM